MSEYEAPTPAQNARMLEAIMAKRRRDIDSYAFKPSPGAARATIYDKSSGGSVFIGDLVGMDGTQHVPGVLIPASGSIEYSAIKAGPVVTYKHGDCATVSIDGSREVDVDVLLNGLCRLIKAGKVIVGKEIHNILAGSPND